MVNTPVWWSILVSIGPSMIPPYCQHLLLVYQRVFRSYLEPILSPTDCKNPGRTTQVPCLEKQIFNLIKGLSCFFHHLHLFLSPEVLFTSTASPLPFSSPELPPLQTGFEHGLCQSQQCCRENCSIALEPLITWANVSMYLCCANAMFWTPNYDCFALRRLGRQKLHRWRWSEFPCSGRTWLYKLYAACT